MGRSISPPCARKPGLASPPPARRPTAAAEVVWSKLARDHLVDIYVRIGLADPQAAERLFDRIERRAQGLARQPRMGRRRPDIRSSARVLVEAPDLILYETRPDTDGGVVDEVELVDVVGGRRDLGSTLGSTG